MGRVIKITIGSVLLGISAIYLFGIILVMADAKESASYGTSAYLQMEYEGGENAGTEPKTEWGEQLTADNGYEFYRLKFTAHNQSTVKYYRVPASALEFDAENYDDVQWNFHYEEYKDYDSLFYDAANACLPGKASADVVVYAQVKKGVKEITASYYPNWDQEKVSWKISLE